MGFALGAVGAAVKSLYSLVKSERMVAGAYEVYKAALLASAEAAEKIRQGIVMIIEMHHENEDAKFIWYAVEVEFAVGTIVDQNGKIRTRYAKKSGIFKFNKIDDLKEASIAFEPNTAPEILENKKIKFACLQKMLICKKNNLFPQVLEWASC